MHFEVNGESYFLNYVPAQGWVLLAPSPRGIRATPVINDDAVEGFSHIMLDEGQDGKLVS